MDFVIQEALRQHESMADFHKDSVNTIRIMLLNLNGEIHILSSLLRMGVNGNRVDNMVSGGVNCAIFDDGHVSNKLYNAIGQQFDGHPNTGDLSKFRVSAIDKIKEAVISSHKQLPYMGIISWDFAVDECMDPVLIEFNLKPQGLDLHQRENGPLFGEMTPEILDIVFSKKES